MSEAADVPHLVRLWDERLRRDASRFERLAPEAMKSGTLLREPASERDIAVAERRLGVTLPPTYRAFLQCSNGAYASSLGPELQHWGDTGRHGFIPVQQVARFADTKRGQFLIDLWTGDDVADLFMDPARDKPPTGNDVAQVSYFAPMRDALLISQPFDAFEDLLVPRIDGEEWELWTFAKEGAGAYRSFAAFLQNRINQPDRRPNPELADLYAAEVRDGIRHRLNDLAEIGDARVGPLAFAYMLDPAVDEFMKRGWAQPVGKVADPAHVPDLRRMYAQATFADFRIELLHALIRCGDPDIEETLQAVADDADDDAHRWAKFVLPRLHQLRSS